MLQAKRNGRLRIGRPLSLLPIVAVIVSCSQLNPYLRAMPHMLEAPYATLCWAPKEAPLPVSQDACDNGLGDVLLKICADELKRSSHWYAPTGSIEDNLLRCMDGKGWKRAILRGYLITPA
jgi:hypothetical protein